MSHDPYFLSANFNRVHRTFDYFLEPWFLFKTYIQVHRVSDRQTHQARQDLISLTGSRSHNAVVNIPLQAIHRSSRIYDGHLRQWRRQRLFFRVGSLLGEYDRLYSHRLYLSARRTMRLDLRCVPHQAA